MPYTRLQDGSAPHLRGMVKAASLVVSESGVVFEAELTYYLHMSSEMRLDETENGATLRIDVCGTQSLLSDFEPWLTQYEEDLPEDTILSGLELVAGFLHLADVLATMHLVTALPVISHGQFLRTTASDKLTDLWLMRYDIFSDANCSIGVCEVCHRPFIGSNKNKRGHKEGMNRRRVAKSRARRFRKTCRWRHRRGRGVEDRGDQLEEGAGNPWGRPGDRRWGNAHPRTELIQLIDTGRVWGTAPAD